MKRLLRLLLRRRTLYVLFAIFLGTLAFKFGKDEYKEYKWKKYVAGLKNTASPGVAVLKDTAYIDYLNEKRTLRVYLPPAYKTDTATYPVIYFFDGPSLYNNKSLEGPEWRVDEVIDSIVSNGGIGAIVIGIDDSSERNTEYKPFLSPYLPEEKEVTGDKHVEWIATDLKNWVDQNYRTKQEARFTTIGGASLGGLMAYYAITQYPGVFGNAIVFSPSFWVNEKVFELHQGLTDLDDKKIYINVGEKEGGLQKPNAEKVFDILKSAGMTSENLRYEIEEDEGHWHPTWRKGFSKAYPWIIQR